MVAERDANLAKVAARQHGLISRAQAKAAGLTSRQLRYRLRKGRWRRVQDGVYVITGVPPSWQQVVMAAVLAAGEEAVASLRHRGRPVRARPARTAGDHPRERAEHRGPTPMGTCVHRTRALDGEDQTIAVRIPVTTPTRTLVDLAGILDRATLIALVDDAICARVVTRAALHRRAVALRNGRRGVAAIIDVTRPGAEGEFRSWLERQLAHIIRQAQLPTPDWNSRIDGKGRIGEVDAVYGEQRVAIEVDGLRFHSSPAQRRRDDARIRRFALAGWVPLRFTWLDVVAAPELVVSEIREALTTRAVAS